MSVSTLPEVDTWVDTSILDEMVKWIKALTAAGVSPDRAAEIAQPFFLDAHAYSCQNFECDGEEDEEDDEE